MRWSSALMALVLAVGAAGCGIRPTGVIDAGRPAGGPWVFFLDEGRLYPVARPNESNEIDAVVSLFQGPSAEERVSGLTTALPDGIELSGADSPSGIVLDLSVVPAQLSALAMLQIACTVRFDSSVASLTLRGPGRTTRSAPRCPASPPAPPAARTETAPRG